MSVRRRAQDYEFEVTALRDRRLRRLVSVVDHGQADDRPIVVYVQLEEEDGFHRFFLDVGWAVWEESERVEEDEEGDGVRLVEIGSRWQIDGRCIRHARASRGSRGLAVLCIELDDGSILELAHEDEADAESAMVLRRLKR